MLFRRQRTTKIVDQFFQAAVDNASRRHLRHYLETLCIAYDLQSPLVPRPGFVSDPCVRKMDVCVLREFEIAFAELSQVVPMVRSDEYMHMSFIGRYLEGLDGLLDFGVGQAFS